MLAAFTVFNVTAKPTPNAVSTGEIVKVYGVPA